MKKPRVLHCITVYNGRSFVPRAITSAMRMAKYSDASVDVLILDDASPEPGWSGELEAICRNMGAIYYRTPRNLGIPRNVSLGMLTALEKGYDYVTINNSDVIFPRNLINSMLPIASQPRVGSVTAWSNNVSIYSLPNEDPDEHLSSQDVVDKISEVCTRTFTHDAIDIPAGISFCIMMPTDVVKEVGIMDPCFGRGYCEETDWSLRSLAAGYRLCLAPAAFVYHQGRGSNQAAGLVQAGATTVPANEAIIDMRYPAFRMVVDAFIHSRKMEELWARAQDAIIADVALREGYNVNIGWLDSIAAKGGVSVNLRAGPEGVYGKASALGFSTRVEMSGVDPVGQLFDKFGGSPEFIRISDRQAVPQVFESMVTAGAVRTIPYRYPSCV